MAEIVFYGDFNCPFCYAENERLIKMGVHQDIDFRGIEHWPELPTPWDRKAEWVEEVIEKEIPRLRERAPDIEVNKPHAISNSKPGNIALAEAIAIDRAKAADFRTNLFRALWFDGKDISTDEVIDEAWALAGLPPRSHEARRDARRRAKVWTVEWDTGPFNRRIPVLATPEGERLLGLADPEEIHAFLGDTRQGGHKPDVCKTR